MNTWFIKNLGDAMLAGESLDHLKSLFLSEHEKTNYPKDMALFIRHESEGQLHCEVKVYFSPASASVANAVNALPCNKPASDSLGLLAGSEESWTTFFPKDDT